MQLWPECSDRCHGNIKAYTKQIVRKQWAYKAFSHSYMHFMFNNAQTRSLYSAVDKDLQIEMSCNILN